MLIDWFTVVAQLLNFLVLIWLMKRFLYQPILNALDAREHRISTELSDADNKKQQAQAEQDEFLRKNQEFEQQRAELLKVAIEEANAEKQRLLNEARLEGESLRLKQQEMLKTEQQSLIASISRRTQTEVLAVVRQALTDLAGVSLENHLVAVFLEKLQQLKDNEKQPILLAAQNPATPLSVRTAFELSPSQQVEMTAAVQKIFSVEMQLQFSLAPHLVSGIEQ
jgi:F-type H+-transporting ATPase subunit b